jgi:hypothetical protein
MPASGRNPPNGPAHARIYHKWIELPAWRTLSGNAVKLLTETLARHRPGDPNLWPMSNLHVATRLNCSQNTAAKVVSELLERGWFCLERKGGVSGRTSSRVRIVSLSSEGTATRHPEPWRFENWIEPRPKPTV